MNDVVFHSNAIFHSRSLRRLFFFLFARRVVGRNAERAASDVLVAQRDPAPLLGHVPAHHAAAQREGHAHDRNAGPLQPGALESDPPSRLRFDLASPPRRCWIANRPRQRETMCQQEQHSFNRVQPVVLLLLLVEHCIRCRSDSLFVIVRLARCSF